MVKGHNRPGSSELEELVSQGKVIYMIVRMLLETVKKCSSDRNELYVCREIGEKILWTHYSV